MEKKIIQGVFSSGGSGYNRPKGTGNDGGDGLEARVAKLESDVDFIKRDVTEIKSDIKDVKNDITDLKVGMVELKSDISSGVNKILVTLITITAVSIAAAKFLF